jgi:hypothetical protein
MSGEKLTLGRPSGGSQFGSVSADMSMLATMVDMGFDRRKAERALIGVQNKSIDLAINYIYNNISELEEEEEPKQEVKETVSQSTPFVSTTPMAPTNMPTLMEEHRKLVKGGLQGDDAQQKESFRRKLLEEEAANREKERRNKQQALKDLRRKMKQEKDERLERQNKKLQETSIVVKPYVLDSSSKTNSGSSSPAPTSQPTTTTPTKECVIQIRLPEGTQLKATLQPTQTLADLVAFIIQNRSDEEQTGDEFSLLIPFPRKEFMPDQFESTTLQQAGLAPRGSLTVQKLKSKGIVTKGSGGMQMDTGGDDEGYDEEPQMPTTGGFLGNRPLEIDEPDMIPVEGDEQKRTSALLCSQQWLHSREEQKEEEDTMIFRPSTYKFPQTLSGTGKHRNGMNFLPSGSYSESRVGVNGQSSHVGTWKLRYDRRSGTVALELNVANESPKIFRIAALTDEVLILLLVQTK